MANEEYNGNSFDGLLGYEIENKDDHQCIQMRNVAILMERTKNFERWQQSQNGSIYRVEKKLDGLISRVDNKLDPVASEVKDISNRVSVVEGFKVGRAEAEDVNIGKWRIRQDRIALYVAAAAGVFTLLNVLASFIPRALGW